MSDRVEVLPGPGTVLRHGNVAIWAGPSSSQALLMFLLQSARNVGGSARAGVQIVDHIAGILSTRDPEPGAPFAVIGPSIDAWITLLHGPVQLWDGTRWLAPTPQPGWLRSDVRPLPAAAIGPAGAPSPQLDTQSPYDLIAGTVPGGGLILVPGPRSEPAATTGFGAPTGFATAAAGRALPPPGPGVAPPRSFSPGGFPPPDAVPPAAVPAPSRMPAAGPDGAPIPPPLPVPVETPPASVIQRGPELVAPPGARRWASLRDAVSPPRPALPLGGAVTPSDRPQVAGVRCVHDHFNHPASRTCAWCGRAVTAGQPQTVGPRPAMGVLIADDGSTYRLDDDLVLGSEPTTDPGVAEGRLRGLVIAGAPGQLAPTHLEIRLSDWTVDVVDRGSAGGTFVVPAGTTGWNRLTPYQPTVLTPGSHISLGQRVLTYISPWPG